MVFFTAILAYSAVAPAAYPYAYSAYPAATYPALSAYAASAYAAYPAGYAAYPAGYTAYPKYANDDGSYWPGKYEKTFIPTAYRAGYPLAYHYWMHPPNISLDNDSQLTGKHSFKKKKFVIKMWSYFFFSLINCVFISSFHSCPQS